jgi:hypothetical protein
MRTSHLSALLGLTTSVAVVAPLSAQAATFNFDYNQLQFIKARPIDSNQTLSFNGFPSENQGYTGFFNPNESALDHGHREIGLNSRGDQPTFNNAPYYTTGRAGSPEVPASGATRTTSLYEIKDFPTFSSYLTNNGISLNSIGFNYGQKSDQDFSQTWNLGKDIIGQDWLASGDSSIEQRIYKANPNNVEFALYEGTNKIVTFDYSNLYSVIDYGSTKLFTDDFEANFTDPIKATKVLNLNPLLGGLADAFLTDVTTGGGGIQVVFEDYGETDLNFKTGNGYNIFALPFPAQLRAVPITAVPETSYALGLLIFGAFGVISRFKTLKTS